VGSQDVNSRGPGFGLPGVVILKTVVQVVVLGCREIDFPYSIRLAGYDLLGNLGFGCIPSAVGTVDRIHGLGQHCEWDIRPYLDLAFHDYPYHCALTVKIRGEDAAIVALSPLVLEELVSSASMVKKFALVRYSLKQKQKTT
jgi:hypothetical protein